LGQPAEALGLGRTVIVGRAADYKTETGPGGLAVGVGKATVGEEEGRWSAESARQPGDDELFWPGLEERRECIRPPLNWGPVIVGP